LLIISRGKGCILKVGKRVKNRLILIDGSALAYRSYFAFKKNPLRNSKGENTSAIFGVANSVIKLLNEQEFTHIAMCFDTPERTKRHRIFPAYKATREKMPEELGEQLQDIKAIIEAMGIPIIEKAGVEADDIVGTLTKAAISEDFFVTLISWDKDFLQLLTDKKINMIKPARGKISEELITAESVRKKLGISPEQMVDYLALVGDTSDNIPGVPGVGPKSAASLLQKFGSIENILLYKEQLKSKKIIQVLDEEKIELSRKLVTIDTNVDLNIELNSLKFEGKDESKLMEFFKKFEFTSLFGALVDKDEKHFTVKEILWNEIENTVRKIDTLASIEFLNVGDFTYLSIAAEGNCWIAKIGSDELKENGVLQDFLNREDVLKISNSVKSLLHLLCIETLSTAYGFFDTSIASYLLDPSRGSHTTDFVALRFENRIAKKPVDLVKAFKKGKIEEAEIKKEVSKYAEINIGAYQKMVSMLKEESLDKLFTEIEMPLVSVLARIEKVGIAIDRTFFSELSRVYDNEVDAIEKGIHLIAGEVFNVRSTKQLQRILFEKLEMKPPKKTKTGFSTDSETLLILSQQHDLPKEILKFRELFKLKSTYIDTLPKLADNTGRIHTNLAQVTTSTGRLASRDPNLQNIPTRGELGREIRKGFIAPPGMALLSCDYSQIELRVLAHISDDANLKQAFFDELDIHRKTAASIFKIPEEDITREMRRRAKVVNFGIIYGMSPYGLAKELSITPEEGMLIINAYFDTYPGVKKWIELSIEETKERGFTETLLGRKRRIPELVSEDFNTREFGKRIAINTPIQGTAADIIKIAMIRIDKKMRSEFSGVKMVLQIHDELLFEVDGNSLKDAKGMIKFEMENAYTLSVPLKVEIGEGKNWDEAH